MRKQGGNERKQAKEENRKWLKETGRQALPSQALIPSRTSLLVLQRHASPVTIPEGLRENRRAPYQSPTTHPGKGEQSPAGPQPPLSSLLADSEDRAGRRLVGLGLCGPPGALGGQATLRCSVLGPGLCV